MKGLYMILLGAVSFTVTAMGQTTNTFPLNGNVGIGTTSPWAKLHVIGNVQFDGIYDGTNNIRFTPAGGTGNIWELYPQPYGYGIFNRNTSNYPFLITNDDNVGIGTIAPENAESWQRVLEVKGFYHSKMLVSTDQINSGIWSHSSGFYGAPAGGITGTATNHHFSIITNKTARMVVTSGGDVGIGTTDPRGYKLAVAGNMIAESVKVSLQGTWPDYVFAKDYNLPTLQETEKHIKDKGHLPGIPSAAEVKANGIDLGEMNAKLLQKIEELTLHLIEMKEENKNLTSRVTQLENKKWR